MDGWTNNHDDISYFHEQLLHTHTAFWDGIFLIHHVLPRRA